VHLIGNLIDREGRGDLPGDLVDDLPPEFVVTSNDRLGRIVLGLA